MEKQKTILTIFKKIITNIALRRRKQFWILLGGMISVAALETMTLGAIAFFATAVSSPEKILDSPYIVRLESLITINNFTSIEGLIIILSIFVFLIVVIKNGVTAIVQYWSARFAATIRGFYGEFLLNKFFNVPYEWHLKENPADLINAVEWRFYFGQFIDSFLLLLSDSIVVVVMIGALIIVRPIVTIAILIILGSSSFFILSRIKKVLNKETVLVREYNRHCFKEASKGIHGIKDVIIFGKEKYFHNIFRNSVYSLARLLGKQRLLAHAPSWLLESAGFFMLSFAVISMFFIIKATTTNIFATLALLSVTAWKVLPALNRIMRYITEIRTTIPFIDRVFDYLRRTSVISINNQKTTSRDIMFEKNITFENVYYHYNNESNGALKYCSFVIYKDKSVGIIGHSGAGKSTLVDIIIGLLKPQMGKIYVDGKQIAESDWSKWRSIIGYVPQFPYIYDGSIAENVAFGIPKESIDRDIVIKVCEMASMEFLKNLDKGIDTIIGERGIRLSGGQRQRVAIARALYNSPQILIFDEATSSLDNKSEKEIQKTIYSLRGKHTLIIIAHRLTTVEDCDYLIWLENGKVIKIGNPEEIINEYSKVK